MCVFLNNQLAQAFGLISLLIIVSLGFAAPVTPPPGTPDAGSILREIEQLKPQKLPPTTPKVEEAPKVQEKSVTKVLVKGFHFQGNQLIKEDLLQAQVKKYIGQELTIEDLQNVAAEVAAFYREKGYLAVGRLPKQDVTEGIVIIEIEEAKYGGVVIPDKIKQQLTRVDPDVVSRYVSHNMTLGEPLSLKKLDRSLLILTDVPGVEAQGSLVPGGIEGETQVNLDAKNKPLLSGDITADNWGSRSTGRNRALLDLLVASPVKIGDSVSFSGLYTDGTSFGRLEYALPLGYDGLRLGVNSSHLNYHLITSDFASTAPKGVSTTYGADVNYPLIRSQAYNLSFTGTYDYKYFNNEYLNSGSYTASSDYVIQVYTLGLTDVETDTLYGGGTTVGTINWGIGNVDLSNSPNLTTDSLNAKTNGGYQRLRLGINRTQTLTQNYSLYLSVNGQYASKNLDSSEKIYLGGATGVRAYPTSEGGGDIGYQENIELRRRFNDHWQLAGFVDSGMIAQNKNNIASSGSAINAVNAYHLSGYGLMATYIGPYQSVMKVIWSHRIGGNPNPTTAGLDQAGSLIYNQFWLSAMLPF